MRVADVVAEERHRREAGERPQELLERDSSPTERRRPGNFTEIRIRKPGQQRRPTRQLRRGELIQVRIGHAEPRVLRPQVADLEVEVAPQRLLNRDIPLLRIPRAHTPVDPEHALAEAGVWIRRTRSTEGPFAKTNAGTRLSCDCCPTVCTNGNCGSVNGDVMPVCSNQISPYPARIAVLLPARRPAPAGARNQDSSSRAVCGKSRTCLRRLKMAPRSCFSVDGKFSV